MHENRGGCLICMDYGPYASDNFVRLVRHFDAIAHVLTLHLLEMEQYGFDLNNGYLFGFSFGGQLVVEAGHRIGEQSINQIDSKFE